MKTKNYAKKALVMTIMMFMFVMNAQAQQKRMMEFQMVMAMNETTYKNCLKEGKYKEAITSLTTLINILDTTTIHKDTDVPENLIKESKGMYQYDLACCFAITGQKKQALQALEKSVDNGYKDYNNMLNDNDLKTLRKDTCKKISRFNPESDYREQKMISFYTPLAIAAITGRVATQLPIQTYSGQSHK
jgi:hypothetical protein